MQELNMITQCKHGNSDNTYVISLEKNKDIKHCRKVDPDAYKSIIIDCSESAMIECNLTDGTMKIMFCDEIAFLDFAKYGVDIKRTYRELIRWGIVSDSTEIKPVKVYDFNCKKCNDSLKKIKGCCPLFYNVKMFSEDQFAKCGDNLIIRKIKNALDVFFSDIQVRTSEKKYCGYRMYRAPGDDEILIVDGSFNMHVKQFKIICGNFIDVSCINK